MVDGNWLWEKVIPQLCLRVGEEVLLLIKLRLYIVDNCCIVSFNNFTIVSIFWGLWECREFQKIFLCRALPSKFACNDFSRYTWPPSSRSSRPASCHDSSTPPPDLAAAFRLCHFFQDLLPPPELAASHELCCLLPNLPPLPELITTLQTLLL